MPGKLLLLVNRKGNANDALFYSLFLFLVEEPTIFWYLYLQILTLKYNVHTHTHTQ